MGRYEVFKTAVRCGVVAALSDASPLIKILQFSMSFIDVESFRQNKGVAHMSTMVCDTIQGIENIDTFFAITCSLIGTFVCIHVHIHT